MNVKVAIELIIYFPKHRNLDISRIDTNSWMTVFGEVYRRIYGQKFSFTSTRERSRKT